MNALTNRLIRDHTFIDRALRNHHYERAPGGLRLRNGLFIGGHAEVSVNGGPALIAPNLVVDQGINYLLGAGILAVTQDGQWHLAPYSGTTSVAASLTAASFAGTQTEFTNYSESARPNWTAVAGTKSLTNSAAPAVITINADNQTIRGLGVISVGTKSASSGILLAAVPFGAAKTGMNTNETLSLTYTLTGDDDGA
jgi:hypothetical protein